ncbi:MAG: GatB/YqeY domain-containing protein [Calditrichia bacterium]
MTIAEKIMNDMKAAMKSGDKASVEALRMLRAAIKNAEIDSGKSLSEEDIMQILSKEAKRRKESAEEYQHAGRADLAEKELSELKLIEAYLPEQLSADEIQALIDEVFEEVKPASMKEMGKVMGQIMPKVKGRADGKLVQQLVQKKFNNLS